MTPFATVLIPTTRDKGIIQWSIRSVLDQTFSDLELFVVGDGAPPTVRDTVLEMARADPRIRYFDFPKGPGRGEANRHAALAEARGRIVAYNCDDDLWLPHHLASMARFLREIDFGHSRAVEVDEYGRIHGHGGGIEDPVYREIMLSTNHINPGLATLAHTMDAYRRLPAGWQPAPPGQMSDLTMIRRFFAVPGLRFGTLLEPSTLRFGSWEQMTRFPDQEAPRQVDSRQQSISLWSERIREPGFVEEYEGLVQESAARRAGFGIHADRVRREKERQLELTNRQMEETRDQLAQTERAFAEAVAAAEYGQKEVQDLTARVAGLEIALANSERLAKQRYDQLLTERLAASRAPKHRGADSDGKAGEGRGLR